MPRGWQNRGPPTNAGWPAGFGPRQSRLSHLISSEIFARGISCRRLRRSSLRVSCGQRQQRQDPFCSYGGISRVCIFRPKLKLTVVQQEKIRRRKMMHSSTHSFLHSTERDYRYRQMAWHSVPLADVPRKMPRWPAKRDVCSAYLGLCFGLCLWLWLWLWLWLRLWLRLGSGWVLTL